MDNCKAHPCISPICYELNVCKMNITSEGDEMAKMRHESRKKMSEKVVESKKIYKRVKKHRDDTKY